MHPIKRILNKVGVDVIRFRPNYTHHSYVEEYSRAIVGSNKWVNVVVDVGAHAGLYAQKMRASGFTGAIHCFEPQPKRYSEITARAQGDKNWHVYNRGVGNENAILEFNVDATDDTSSSFLKKAATAPGATATVNTTKVEVVALDAFLLPKLSPQDNLWLKIDAEGFEDRVLKGAKRLLAQARFVEIELSFIKRFAAGCLAHEIIALLAAEGFVLYSMDNNYYIEGHRLNYSDAIFVKQDFVPPEI